MDVLPTVCGLAGVPLPAGLDGRNLAGPGGRIEADPDHIATGYRRRLPGDGGCGYFDALTARSRDHRLTVYRGGSGEQMASAWGRWGSRSACSSPSCPPAARAGR